MRAELHELALGLDASSFESSRRRPLLSNLKRTPNDWHDVSLPERGWLMEGPFRLDDRLVEPRRNEIVRNDGPVKLEPRIMEVLVCLAARPGEVVSREDLLAAVWDGTFVADEVLTVAIGKLRRALEDDARSPQFIQTVWGTGYRMREIA